MFDRVTAILPSRYSELISGGKIACISSDGEIEWRVEKKQQVADSHKSELNIKFLLRQIKKTALRAA